MDRRGFLTALGATGLAGCAAAPPGAEPASFEAPDREQLRAVWNRPILRRAYLPDPIIIDRIEVLGRDGQAFVKATDADGHTGWVLGNPRRLNVTWPILMKHVAPFFIGKDMRDYEFHLAELYRHQSNYKLQGLLFWVCVARVEYAILDLIGRRVGRPVYALLGERVRDSIGIYYANGDRSHSADWVVDRLEESIAETGAKAVKFKVGARMAMTDASTARDLALIPMARERLGAGMTLYADSNGSYDVPAALQIGQLLEQYDYGFFEEPVPWDHLEETRAVADALAIPIAGGEQEASQWRFEWQIANGALQVVQPDLINFGGLIRALRVAAMAREAGLMAVPHLARVGLGNIYTMQFCAIVPNTTDFQEYKGDNDPVPYEMTGQGGRYVAVDGRLPVLDGPGLGVTFDPDYLSSLEPLA